jgi:hypothetical protein
LSIVKIKEAKKPLMPAISRVAAEIRLSVLMDSV